MTRSLVALLSLLPTAAPASVARLLGGGGVTVAAARPRAASPRLQFGGGGGGFKNPFSDKQSGATTVMLTLAFRVAAADRGPRSVLGTLDDLASAADTTTAEGLAALAGDTALALMRREVEWIACCGTAEHRGKDDAALALFDRLALEEAAKFDDRSPAATVDAALVAAGLGGGGGGGDSGGALSPSAESTLAVVCCLVCLMGDREESMRRSFAGDAGAMKAALQEVYAGARAVDEVFAFELFWVPGADDEVLDMDEMVLDWPQLIQC